MLTSYSVHCPHVGCNWFGSLLPLDRPEAWSNSLPTINRVHFQCPECQGTWQARVVGDDVVNLPLEEEALPWA
jgi:hypothetical protein